MARPTSASLARHGVKAVVMPGVGHFLMLEDPKRFDRVAGIRPSRSCRNETCHWHRRNLHQVRGHRSACATGTRSISESTSQEWGGTRVSTGRALTTLMGTAPPHGACSRPSSNYFEPEHRAVHGELPRREAARPARSTARGRLPGRSAKPEDSEFGKFGWVVDPDGNKIELWEPPTRAMIFPLTVAPRSSRRAIARSVGRSSVSRHCRRARSGSVIGKNLPAW